MGYIGGGAMGAVYYALSPVMGSLAIKILKPDLLARFPEFGNLFAREIKAVSSLDHPNIARFVTSGKMVEGYPFVAVEWLDGKTLDQYFTNQVFSMDEAVTFFKQVGLAMAHAHARKVIHLDLKPENVFLCEQRGKRFVKVIDFGLSRILSTYSGTTATRFAGTLHYCSPEHFGGKVSPRSDIFSLGILLYHMITGVLPVGATFIGAKQSGGPLPPIPRLSGSSPANRELESIIDRAVRYEPAERYQTVKELLRDLDRLT